MKKISSSYIKDILSIAAITMITAMGIFFFMIPSGVAVSSVSGVAMVLGHFVPLSISTLTLLINIVLLVACYFLVDPDFCKRTVVTSILLPVYLAILEHLFPNQQSITGDPFLDVLGYIFIIGWSVSLLIQRNSSSGGTDIVAKIISKYLHMDFGQAISVSGMVISLSSALTSPPKLVFLAVLGTYLQGMALDYFIFGMHAKKRVCILSQKEKEIEAFLLQDLHCGATIYNAIGAYNGDTRPEIVTILDRSQYGKLMTFLGKTDPDAFVTVIAVKEVLCKPRV